MTEMYLWVGILWYDACRWVSVYVKLSTALAVGESLCTMSTFVNTPDDEYKERRQLCLYSLAKSRPLFFFACLFAPPCKCVNFIFSSVHLLPHMHNLKLCSIAHTIIFKLLILLINLILLSFLLSFPFPNCMLEIWNGQYKIGDIQWNQWILVLNLADT